MMEAYSRRMGSGDKSEGIAAALSASGGGLHAKGTVENVQFLKTFF